MHRSARISFVMVLLFAGCWKPVPVVDKSPSATRPVELKPVEKLLLQLNTDDQNVIRDTFLQLVTFGPEANPILIHVLNSGDQYKSAIKVLKTLRPFDHPKLAELLIELLVAPKSTEHLKSSIADMLTEGDGAAGYPYLERLSEANTFYPRSIIVHILRSKPPVGYDPRILRTLLRSEDATVRIAAMVPMLDLEPETAVVAILKERWPISGFTGAPQLPSTLEFRYANLPDPVIKAIQPLLKNAIIDNDQRQQQNAIALGRVSGRKSLLLWESLPNDLSDAVREVVIAEEARLRKEPKRPPNPEVNERELLERIRSLPPYLRADALEPLLQSQPPFESIVRELKPLIEPDLVTLEQVRLRIIISNIDLLVRPHLLAPLIAHLKAPRTSRAPQWVEPGHLPPHHRWMRIHNTLARELGALDPPDPQVTKLVEDAARADEFLFAGYADYMLRMPKSDPKIALALVYESIAFPVGLTNFEPLNALERMKPVLPFAQHADPEVRLLALLIASEGLSRLDDPKQSDWKRFAKECAVVAEMLRTALADPDPKVRAVATYAIWRGKLAEVPTEFAPLIPIGKQISAKLQTKQYLVRAKRYRKLSGYTTGRMGHCTPDDLRGMLPDILAVLREVPFTSERDGAILFWGLREIGPECVPGLRLILEHADPHKQKAIRELILELEPNKPNR